MTEYTSDRKRFCSVYKSSKKKEMYLYVDRKYDLKTLPEALIPMFGQPLHVMDMILTPEKKLARVSSGKVLEMIADKGYFLQMPPLDNDDLAGDYVAPNDSLNG
mgnify:CR=1 FL=1|tara:strand:- start:588 stop:899 length:312 start_codon:yes stop_codon:yes gene_type:complete